MKRLFLILLALVVLSPIPLAGQIGAYNPVSNMLICSTYSNCLHEIGHALDKQSGWVSDTKDFRNAIQIYLLTNQNESAIKIVNTLLTSNQNAHRELYANLFEWSGGNPDNMPESLRQFYDWQMAAGLIGQLEEGKHIYLARTGTKPGEHSHLPQ